MAKDKKKHHFVPASYLRHFADEDGYVAVIRKSDPTVILRSKPSETAFRNYYYSQPLPEGGQENNALEGVFSTFESEWPATASTLITKQGTNAVLSHLMLFMALQRLRVPAFRDAIEQSLQNHARKGFEALKQAGGLPPPPPEFPDIASHVEITIDPHQSIHAMLLVRDELGPILDSFGYVVVHNRTSHDFVTSDNPVAYFESKLSDTDIMPYSWSRDRRREIIFPIAPDTLIYGSSDDRERFRSRGLKHVEVRDDERVSRFNRLTARFAYEAVFGRGHVPIRLVQKYAGASPVLDPSFPGFHPDAIGLPPHVFGARRRLPKWR